MRSIAAILLLSSLLAACGQTGPLYLPGEEPPRRKVGPAPAEQPAPTEQDAGATAPEN